MEKKIRYEEGHLSEGEVRKLMGLALDSPEPVLFTHGWGNWIRGCDCGESPDIPKFQFSAAPSPPRIVNPPSPYTRFLVAVAED
jgi:hypothetical protein